MKRVFLLLCFIAALFSLQFAAVAQPQTTHPRIWVTQEDLPRLRSWAVNTNPMYVGLTNMANEVKALMDNGTIPQEDNGGNAYEAYPTEMYAQLFAFMSLISNDPAERADYAQRARTLLMHIIDQAALGMADGEPFRGPGFAIRDRSRWFGSSFGTTVDWIYPILTAEDKAKIRTVFLRWIDENNHATTAYYDHPEPFGVVNDPALVSNLTRVRFSNNNYYNAHLRNVGLMALSFDPADDPDGALTFSALQHATGAWLYVSDYNIRTELIGGLPAEGFQYGPQSMGYVTQFLLALHTSGQANPAQWGYQVDFNSNPYWNNSFPAYFHSLTPATTINPDVDEVVYQPAWYGDAEKFWNPDWMGYFGPIGLYDYRTGNMERLNAIRWLQIHTAPGGAATLADRAENDEFMLQSIFYFLLFDPNAPQPTDPRSTLSNHYFVPGLNRFFERTSWTPDASWFTYKLSWNSIWHQSADGNAIEFYRKGEWLTKHLVGYGFGYVASDHKNTLAIENDQPPYDDYREMLWARGSQPLYASHTAEQNPPVPLYSVHPEYTHVQGDSTNLYNAPSYSMSDVLHASRSIVWLKPDYLVVYDRATTGEANRFKRFFLNFDHQPTLTGNVTTATTTNGQHLHVTTLLPANATINVQPVPVEAGEYLAQMESMSFRLNVRATGDPQDARFLHVLQGADGGTPAMAAHLVPNIEGAFTGVLVNDKAVFFATTLNTPFTSLAYAVPSNVTGHVITGLQPGSGYNVNVTEADGAFQLMITAGTTYTADTGGTIYIQTLSSEHEILTNGGFEFGPNNEPLGWNAKFLSKDKRKCNTAAFTVAQVGNCAFKFKGIVGERSKLIQTQPLNGLNLSAGDRLDFSAWVKSGAASRALIKVVITYQDAPIERMKIPVTTGNSTYQQRTNAITLTGSPSQAKIIIRYRSTVGKVWMDGISLRYEDVTP